MGRVLGWSAVGAIAIFGGMAFVLGSAFSLHFAVSVPTILVACTLGSALAGAVIARHAVTRPAREILIGAGAAFAIVVVASAAGPFEYGVLAPIARASPAMLGVLAVVVIAGAAGGSTFARRVPASTPSTPLLLLASGVLTMGTLQLSFLIPGDFTLPFVLSISAGGFLAQAIAPVRRPWACGSGGVLLSLSLLQDGDSVLGVGVGVGALVLLGRVGAGIAGRVFSKRFAASTSSLPSARVE